MAARKLGDYPDIVLFSSDIYYCSEDEGSVRVEVVRLGEDEDECSVDYATFDISAHRDVKYIGAKGTIRFEKGEMFKFLEIKLIENESFEAPTSQFRCLPSPSSAGNAGVWRQAGLAMECGSGCIFVRLQSCHCR